MAERKAEVVFAFVQRMMDGRRVRFFYLLDDVPGHCVGSTVSEVTLRKAGVAVPEGGEGEEG